MGTPGTSQSGWASGIQASIAPSNPGLANAIGPYASAEQGWPGAQGSPATAGAAAGVFEGAPAARGAGTQGVPSAPNNNAPANDLSREAFNNMFRGTPMADQYDTVVREAARVGISPALQAGIIAFETGRGRSNAISRYNNPAGLMNPATRGNRGFFSFPTLGAGIARSAELSRETSQEVAVLSRDSAESMRLPVRLMTLVERTPPGQRTSAALWRSLVETHRQSLYLEVQPLQLVLRLMDNRKLLAHGNLRD
jgi:hypothetical protein